MGGSIDVIEHEIVGLVSKAAPILGSVLGTPLGGVALALIAQAFGSDPNNVPVLYDAITKAPDADLKLKSLENEHAEVLEKIASQSYGIEVDDRKDARHNSVQYKDFLRHMAYLVTVGFFGALVLIFLPITINGDSRELLSMLVGMLASKWQTIIDFFYGSSRKQGGIKNG